MRRHYIFLLLSRYHIEMSFVDRKDGKSRRNNDAALLTILVVAALSIALAPTFSTSLITRTAAAELSVVHIPNRSIIVPDKVAIGGGTAGGGTNDDNAPADNNNNADGMNGMNTDNSWCYNQGTDADGKQLTSCWNSQQECQDIQSVDQEATGECFQNPNAQPDESTHNSWCYGVAGDPEDQSCWNSQQECNQARMGDDQATECTKVTGPM
jgi:hypothetical protein